MIRDLPSSKKDGFGNSVGTSEPGSSSTTGSTRGGLKQSARSVRAFLDWMYDVSPMWPDQIPRGDLLEDYVQYLMEQGYD